MRIYKIGILSLGKIMGLGYTVLGLVLGIIFSLMASFGIRSEEAMPAFMGMGAIILMPLLYGAMGIVGGILTALVFNFSSGFVGGLEIETDQGPEETIEQ